MLWPNLAHLLSQTAIIVCAGAALVLASSARARSMKPVVWGTVGALLLHTGLFFAAGKLPHLSWPVVTNDAAGAWLPLCGLVVTTFASAVALLTMVMVAPDSGWDSPEGRGMAILTLGLALMLSYTLVRGGALVVALTGREDAAIDLLETIRGIAAVGLPIVAVGTIFAPVNRAVTAIRDLPRVRRLYARLVGPTPSPTMTPVRELDELLTELGDVLGQESARPPDASLRAWVLAHERPQ